MSQNAAFSTFSSPPSHNFNFITASLITSLQSVCNPTLLPCSPRNQLLCSIKPRAKPPKAVTDQCWERCEKDSSHNTSGLCLTDLKADDCSLAKQEAVTSTVAGIQQQVTNTKNWKAAEPSHLLPALKNTSQ